MYLKFRVQWFLIHTRTCATITTDHFHDQKVKPVLNWSFLKLLIVPCSKKHALIYFLSVLEILYKRDYITWFLFHLSECFQSSFTL